MNEQIEREMRRINWTFLAMAICGCLLGVAVFWSLDVVIRYAIAKLIEAL